MEANMAKVYGIHQIELNPGVTAEEFERFITGKGAALLRGGPKTAILRGDRGARTGRYLMIVEFESEDARNQAYPVADAPPTETLESVSEAQQKLGEKLLALAAG